MLIKREQNIEALLNKRWNGKVKIDYQGAERFF